MISNFVYFEEIYAVLMRSVICRELRVFCANFLVLNLGLCYFLRFFHLCFVSNTCLAAGTNTTSALARLELVKTCHCIRSEKLLVTTYPVCKRTNYMT